MKKKKFSSRLLLGKKTIANLGEEMARVKGGEVTDICTLLPFPVCLGTATTNSADCGTEFGSCATGCC